VKALIVYATRYGTTAACARLLCEALPDGAEVADLGATPSPTLEGRDVVLVGGPIYGGRIHQKVPRFCERNREALLGRKVGLFICCFYTGERARAELAEAFPPWLTGHAFASLPLGGAVRQAALGPVERFLFRQIAGTAEDLERIDRAAIAELAAAAARQVR
jgi:menaquinone-dependent protoporphyrinogen oxidase